MSTVELLHGTLDLLVLRVLNGGPMHGFGIAQKSHLHSETALQVEDGSLYAAVYRMEAKGWIKASWAQTENNRRAKYYELTRASRKQLETEQNGWERLAQPPAGPSSARRNSLVQKFHYRGHGVRDQHRCQERERSPAQPRQEYNLRCPPCCCLSVLGELRALCGSYILPSMSLLGRLCSVLHRSGSTARWTRNFASTSRNRCGATSRPACRPSRPRAARR